MFLQRTGIVTCVSRKKLFNGGSSFYKLILRSIGCYTISQKTRQSFKTERAKATPEWAPPCVFSVGRLGGCLWEEHGCAPLFFWVKPTGQNRKSKNENYSAIHWNGGSGLCARLLPVSKRQRADTAGRWWRWWNKHLQPTAGHFKLSQIQSAVFFGAGHQRGCLDRHESV